MSGVVVYHMYGTAAFRSEKQLRNFARTLRRRGVGRGVTLVLNVTGAARMFDAKTLVDVAGLLNAERLVLPDRYAPHLATLQQRAAPYGLFVMTQEEFKSPSTNSR